MFFVVRARRMVQGPRVTRTSASQCGRRCAEGTGAHERRGAARLACERRALQATHYGACACGGGEGVCVPGALAKRWQAGAGRRTSSQVDRRRPDVAELGRPLALASPFGTACFVMLRLPGRMSTLPIDGREYAGWPCRRRPAQANLGRWCGLGCSVGPQPALCVSGSQLSNGAQASVNKPRSSTRDYACCSVCHATVASAFCSYTHGHNAHCSVVARAM